MDCMSRDLLLQNGEVIYDIQIDHDASSNDPLSLPSTPLRFLAVVEVARIPLYLAVGRSLDVWTSSPDTQAWFSKILLHSQPAVIGGDAADQHEAQRPEAWWENEGAQSALGVLARVVQTKDVSSEFPRVSELLFYSFSSIAGSMRVFAMPLSSDLVYKGPVDASPPQLPDENEGVGEGWFLPRAQPKDVTSGEKAHLVPTKKRMSDVFDEAAKRRKRPHRPPDGGNTDGRVQNPGSSRSETIVKLEPPSTDDGKRLADTKVFQSALDKKTQHEYARTSRSPSLNGDSRPPSRKDALGKTAAKRSSLSLTTSISNAADTESIKSELELRNRDAISRLVMAGMRMYGLTQSRKKSISANGSDLPTMNGAAARSRPATPTLSGSAVDDEYKMVYHHVFKGTTFALRHHITTEPIHAQPDRMRDTVDKLLAVFCTDPLAPSINIDAAATADPATGAISGHVSPHNAKVISTKRSPHKQVEADAAASPSPNPAVALAVTAGT